MPHTKVRVNSGLFTFLPQPGMVDLIITTGFLAVANNLGDVFPFFRVDVRSVYARPVCVRPHKFFRQLFACRFVCRLSKRLTFFGDGTTIA
jgi:hypothetical protein